MVDPEPKLPLTPEVAVDVSAGFGAPGDIHRGDGQGYKNRGGGRGREGTGVGRMEDDPHGNAAMALTALHSGAQEIGTSGRGIRSGFQDISEGLHRQAATGHSFQRSQTERGAGSVAPAYSERPLREAQETLSDASMRAGDGTRQHQQQRSAMQPLALHLPLSAAMTPSSSSSAINTSTMTASESTSPISVQDEAAPRDALVTAQDQYAQQHVPGERMQSLSHMLKDRLSLASFRTERGWDRIDMDVAEQRMVKDGEQQRYHDFQGRFSPSNPDDCPTHSNRFLRERPITPPATLPTPPPAHDRSEELGRQQWEFSHDSRSLQQGSQSCPHHAHSSGAVRNDRVAPHWAQVSPSTTMDPVIVKPKRKYTKKSSLLPQSMGESCDPVEFQSKQERNELLCADRGLIFKTQIPKKGRPISKHSSTSTQSTPTLTSIGVLPASHYYFTKSGTVSSPTSSSPSGMVAASGRFPSNSALSPHTSSPQGGHHLPLQSGQRDQVISPIGKRDPGRPPSNPSLSRLTHPQSYSSAPLISFPLSLTGSSLSFSSPTVHEFDLLTERASQYKDQSNRHGFDDGNFSVYRDRSPTLLVATTFSSQQPPLRYHQQPEQVSSSHHRYVASPVDQDFSEGELGHRKEEEDLTYSERRRRTVDNPSALPPRSFAEGAPAQMNSLKRSSSGMQKSLSMDGYSSRSMEHRRWSGGNVLGHGRRSLGYGTAGQFENVNEVDGSKVDYDDEFDESAVDARSRKRVSGSDLDVGRRVNQGGNSKTWHGAVPGSERRRPRLLVLPRGCGEPALPWATLIDSESGPGSGLGAGSMEGVLFGQRHLDIDDEEIDYREMMIMTPAIAPGPPSQGSSSSSTVIRTTGKSGRTKHNHARSLDISVRTPVHRGSHHSRRPLSPSSLEYPSRSDIYPSEEKRHEQPISSSGRRAHSPLGSLSSPPFGDSITDAIRSRSGYKFDSPTVTKADILAREMSESHGTSSRSGSGRGRRGFSHNRLKAPVVKRSTSKRGPGPHLKKHQILQQQLYQIQREQEEMDLQMVVRHQQQRLQQMQMNQKQQDQQPQQKLQQQQPADSSQRRSNSQRQQHPQSLQLEQDLNPHAALQQQHQPQPGRPTKQRVLLRSESALAVLHGLHSPPLGSLAPSQSQSSLQSTTTITSTSIPTTTSTTTTSQPRRRQNQQQPILLLPVSLPSLSGGGAGGLDSGSSSPYLMNHPPPGQPLFRSLHAPYLVSPSSLVSVASNASSSTGTTGTGATLARGGRGGAGGDDEDEDGDNADSRVSSPVKSPHITYSRTPPLPGSRLYTPPYGLRDNHGYPPQEQHYRQHHHHPYQRPQHTTSSGSIHQETIRSSHPGAMSRSSSRGGDGSGMSASSSTTTLVHSSSHSSLQYNQRRHSASLPSLNYYQSSTSPSPTSPQHPQDQHPLANQQRQSNSSQPTDPTRPPIHKLSFSTPAGPQPPQSQTTTSTTAPQMMHTIGEEESVERLLIRTPLGKV